MAGSVTVDESLNLLESLSCWLTGDGISSQEGSRERECICGLILLMNAIEPDNEDCDN